MILWSFFAEDLVTLREKIISELKELVLFPLPEMWSVFGKPAFIYLFCTILGQMSINYCSQLHHWWACVRAAVPPSASASCPALHGGFGCSRTRIISCWGDYLQHRTNSAVELALFKWAGELRWRRGGSYIIMLCCLLLCRVIDPIKSTPTPCFAVWMVLGVRTALIISRVLTHWWKQVLRKCAAPNTSHLQSTLRPLDSFEVKVALIWSYPSVCFP